MHAIISCCLFPVMRNFIVQRWEKPPQIKIKFALTIIIDFFVRAQSLVVFFYTYINLHAYLIVPHRWSQIAFHRLQGHFLKCLCLFYQDIREK
jgi:hypothetical protein